MATIKEIARHCGVSSATVSKALNGYPDIGDETRERIQKAARELEYFPNSVARALKTNYTNNLGVLFIDKMRSGLGHEYFSSMLESFKVTAEESGYDITFISRNLGGRKMSYLEHCRYRRCDGVVIASVDFEDPEIIELINSNIPIVTVDHVFNNRSAILSDNVQGMQDLLTHAHSLGHRKIAYIHGEDTLVTQKRLAGFHRAAQELGLKIPDEYILPSLYHDTKGSRLATKKLLALPDPPTCILYPDDFSYIGGMNEIEHAGKSIPNDISVAGYDGIYLSQALRPRLTTIKQDTAAIGRAAANQLIAAIQEPKTSFPEQIMIPGQILPGDTIKALY
ncbi:LacI family transcriptional regulator [Clostridiaceae bacterium OttesenSCG-928-D20]|nr:LacI family transcriptional regulator [Clostridiaceae bacterium OttesenSCG-928-D20]